MPALTEFRYESGIVKTTAGSDLSPGAVVVIGNRCGVVVGSSPVKNGSPMTLQTQGIFDMPKLTADVVTEGALLYWDAGNSRCTTTASTHKSIGLAVAAASGSVSRVLVDLNASVASGTI